MAARVYDLVRRNEETMADELKPTENFVEVDINKEFAEPQPEVTPPAPPPPTRKELAELGLKEISDWHQNDDRFQKRLGWIRDYIADLEGRPTPAIANVQPGPDLFPKEDVDTSISTTTNVMSSKGKGKR